MTRRVLLLGIAWALTSACGVSRRVGRDLLEQLPGTSVLLLVGPQAEIDAAVDREAMLAQRIREYELELVDVRRQSAAAAAEAKRVYVKGLIRLLSAERGHQDLYVDLAQARFELVAARLVREQRVVGANGITLTDFERQLREREDRVAAWENQRLARIQRLEVAREHWRKLREASAQREGAAPELPWIEDIATWYD